MMMMIITPAFWLSFVDVVVALVVLSTATAAAAALHKQAACG